ncbi:ABC-2 type transporter protein [Chondrocystis sp. NIES-4102]|nr:ABC-2 type transporter protein [Chondrocystis sp. NIES-4102]
MKIIHRFLESRFWALMLKEIRQIFSNKQLIFLLVFPPTIQLIIFGSSLSPDVKGLSLGLADYANSRESRELVAALTENQIFQVKSVSYNQDLNQQVRTGKIDVGLVIPPEFNQDLLSRKTAEVQVIIDGVDANTAGIAQGYINQIMRQYSQRLRCQKVNCPQAIIQPQVRFLYNPGLISSWFFVPGVLGIVLTLTGSLVSSITLIREKDVGTLEQLLMTPAAEWEILLAKIVPLFILLMGDVLLASGISRLFFKLPFRGNFGLFLILSGLYLFVCIGLGILLATISRTQQQVILTSFFFNIPIIQLSGAIAPIESMPLLFRCLSFFDPLRHYVAINRSLILKGVGLGEVWDDALALFIFAIILLTISIKRFRSQLQ